MHLKNKNDADDDIDPLFVNGAEKCVNLHASVMHFVQAQ